MASKWDKANSGAGGLVLMRGIGETVSIENGLVEIEVIGFKGKRVRLRFRGHVKIDRKEVVDAKIAAGEL